MSLVGESLFIGVGNHARGFGRVINCCGQYSSWCLDSRLVIPFMSHGLIPFVESF
jgi:hypothetical protein